MGLLPGEGQDVDRGHKLPSECLADPPPDSPLPDLCLFFPSSCSGLEEVTRAGARGRAVSGRRAC